jgi:hypothetical protein
MPTNITMVFCRDSTIGPACLEYSWVPQGSRRLIRLPQGLDEDARTDPAPEKASHVQVYRLVSNRVGTDTWQFPAGPPYKSRVVYASIQVFEERGQVVGTVYFADGTSASDTRSLKADHLPCPEFPGD